MDGAPEPTAGEREDVSPGFEPEATPGQTAAADRLEDVRPDITPADAAVDTTRTDTTPTDVATAPEVESVSVLGDADGGVSAAGDTLLAATPALVDSLQILNECMIEPGLANAKAGERYQFERQGAGDGY